MASADRRPAPTYLDFEQPLASLDADIARALAVGARARLRRLRRDRRRVETALLARLSPWERVQLSRHPDRPAMLDYVRLLCSEFVEAQSKPPSMGRGVGGNRAGPGTSKSRRSWSPPEGRGPRPMMSLTD